MLIHKKENEITDMLLNRINEAEQEGFKGVEVEMYMRFYDVTDKVINEIKRKGYDVIIFENEEVPKVLISWD
jgi:hypothetical protein